MKIDVLDIEGISFIDLHGEIDIQNANELRIKLDELINNGKNQIAVNCGNMEYIDSSGLGILIRVKANYTTDKSNELKDLVLYDLSDEVKKTLLLTKLDGFFTVFDNEEQVIEYFKKGKVQ